MIKKFSQYIYGYTKYLMLSPLIVFLEVLCELTIPLLMARIVDVGIANSDVGYIARQGLYMVLLAGAATLLGIANMRFSSLGAMGFGANLRDALFEKVQAFSFTNIDRFSSSSLVTRLTNDANNLQMTLMMSMRLLLRAPMMLVIAIFLAYQINAELSRVMTIAIPVLAISIALIIRAATQRFATVQTRLDALNRAIQENLIGVRVVKSFVREDYEIQKFKGANDNLTDAAISAGSIVVLSFPVMILVINSATLAIIWQGGRLVYAGAMGPGELISFISYIFMIMMSVMMISMVIIMGARAQASGRRTLEVLETEIDIADKPVDPQAAGDQPQVRYGKVEFRNVSFHYKGAESQENILTQISFVAQPGTVNAIVGGTGAGKSTLVHLIPRLYDTTEGEVLVDDISVCDYPLENLREEIGVVLQNSTLFSGTILDNLRWGKTDATQDEIEAAARAAQAQDFIESFPNGYNTELGQAGVNVSGGQKQRLSIARALLKKPKILIMDDSTSAVDSSTEANLRAALNQSMAGMTVFIIAQRISSVRDADQILVLDDGRIVGAGTHAELLAGNPVYKEIYASQQEGVFANV